MSLRIPFVGDNIPLAGDAGTEMSFRDELDDGKFKSLILSKSLTELYSSLKQENTDSSDEGSPEGVGRDAMLV